MDKSSMKKDELMDELFRWIGRLMNFSEGPPDKILALCSYMPIGKTRFLDFLKDLVGGKHCLLEVPKNPVEASRLKTTRLLIVDGFSLGDYMSIAKFKSIVSGDPFHCRERHSMNFSTVIPKCAVAFACNESIQDIGLAGRCLVVDSADVLQSVAAEYGVLMPCKS